MTGKNLLTQLRASASKRAADFRTFKKLLADPSFLNYARRMRRRTPRDRAPDHDRETALREAVGWLCRSQESGPDEGSSCYQLGKGWTAGYPEVTGYNLYTLLEYHGLEGDQAAYDHAIRMADWELTV